MHHDKHVKDVHTTTKMAQKALESAIETRGATRQLNIEVARMNMVSALCTAILSIGDAIRDSTP